MGDSSSPTYTVTRMGPGGRRLHRGYCPHCKHRVEFTVPSGPPPSWSFDETIHHDHGGYTETVTHSFIAGVCPDSDCNKPTIVYEVREHIKGGWNSEEVVRLEVVYPAASTRIVDDASIPKNLRVLYEEAGRIEGLSPNGAAFLARRILERILRTELQDTGRLVELIERYLETRSLPSNLHQMMHDVREFGNIAAHPAESGDGAPIDVESHEATYVLDLIGELFDFIYVRPTRRAHMRERLKAKRRGELPNPAPGGGFTTKRAESALSEPDEELPF